MVDSVTKAKS